MKGTVLLKYL